MEDYLTEEERLEALQRWWKENRNSLMIGILLGIAVLVGWNMWQSNRLATDEQASSLYQQLLKSTRDRQVDTAIKLSERLTEQYPATTYADYARLILAKLKVESNDLAAGKKTLEDALAKTNDELFKHVIRLRLGQVMLALGEIEPALNLIVPLPPEKMGKFQSLYEELKGDLYAASDRPELARSSYQKAKELGDHTSPVLQLKLHDLPTEGKSSGS
jgi:predicted negative regulator of RcsB-dependent stress response